jgi:hypothetical protein
MTRPWIWDRLSERTKQQVVEYFSYCVGDLGYPRNNWCWFRLTVQTFLKSVGGPWSLADMEQDLALHDSFVRPDGWMSDGDERSYDHYVGWALHLYPTLWARMQGAEELAAPRRATDKANLDTFLADAVKMVGADGAPLIQGRSLAYRYAAAAPYWVGALAEVPSVDYGLLRRAASGIVDYFVRNGSPDDRGLLTQGWRHEWLPMLQSYSGPSSPYWASKGLLGLALPADHEAWTAVEKPLPVEEADVLDVVGPPAWIRSATKNDGIVRIINHGTDHAHEGDQTGDSPLYARLGYSTATWPWLDENSWRNPVDNSVALIDNFEATSHRSGWKAIAPGTQPSIDGPTAETVAVAGSLVDAHWISMPVRQVLHASGWEGKPTHAGRLAVISVVRGPWEVRLVHLIEVSDDAVALRITGWPTVAGDNLSSTVVPLTPGAQSSIITREQVSPMGPGASVPALTFPRPIAGSWVAAMVTLTGSPQPSGEPTLELQDGPSGLVAEVTWPDGAVTHTAVPALG